MVRSDLQQGLHHEVALGKARMRKREHLELGNVALVIQDVQVAGARAVLLLAHAAQAVLDDVQAAQKLLRRQAGAQDAHGVHERVLVFLVSRFALVEAGDVGDLRVGQHAHVGNGLVQHGLLALQLFAGVGHQGKVAAQRNERVGAQVFLQRFGGKRHVVRADHGSAQLAGHKRLCGGSAVALLRVVDLIGLADVALARNRHHGGIAQMYQLVEVAHQGDGLVGRLAEARARIQADALVADAGFLQLGSALGQVANHFGNHILVDRFVLHGARVAALHMHNHQARIAALGNLHHGRIAETRHIVDDAGASLHGCLGNLGMAGVDAYTDALAGQALDNA